MNVFKFNPAFDRFAEGEIFWSSKFDYRVGLLCNYIHDPNVSRVGNIDNLQLVGNLGKDSLSSFPRLEILKPHSGGVCSASDSLVESVPLGRLVRGVLVFIAGDTIEDSLPVIYIEAESQVETNGADILLYWDKVKKGLFSI